MAVRHGSDIRIAVCNLVVDAIDVGAVNPTGLLQLLTAADVVAAELAFDATAFGAADADAIATANHMEADADAVGGTVTKFQIISQDEDVVIYGSYGTTGADLIGTASVIAPGDVVTIEDGDLTYEAMP